MDSSKKLTNRFMLALGLGVLGLILVLFGLGAVLTHFLWPPQDRLSKPVQNRE